MARQTQLTSILTLPFEPGQRPALDGRAVELLEKQGFKRAAVDKAEGQLRQAGRASILSDLPAHEDAFGFSPTVRTIASVVTSPGTETPLTIAVDGEWGSGKSSILRMVETHARMLGFSCIWLNAWSLERAENLIAAVTAEIQEEIKRRGGRGRSDLIRRLRLFAVDAAIGLFPAAVGGKAVREIVDAGRTSEKIGDEIDEVASVASSHRSFKELIEVLLNDKNVESRSQASRLVVFIDDVDRALPDQISIILKNLKLILEVPRCVFILGMDMNIVATSIETYYRRRSESVGSVSMRSDGKGMVFDYLPSPDPVQRGFGHNYLEKLVQIQIRVPRLSADAVVSYLQDIRVRPEVAEIVRWSASEHRSNPRRLKRYINWLSITLQQIIITGLPAGVDSLLALRALALRKDYRVLYLRMVDETGICIKNLVQEMEEKRALDEEVDRIEFARYLEKLQDSRDAMVEFDRFLLRSPIFSL